MSFVNLYWIDELFLLVPLFFLVFGWVWCLAQRSPATKGGVTILAATHWSPPRIHCSEVWRVWCFVCVCLSNGVQSSYSSLHFHFSYQQNLHDHIPVYCNYRTLIIWDWGINPCQVGSSCAEIWSGLKESTLSPIFFWQFLMCLRLGFLGHSGMRQWGLGLQVASGLEVCC